MTEQNHALDQAKAQLECVIELVKDYTDATEADNEEAVDQAISNITEDPLEVGIIKQYFILLCTGGPAVRIIGDLDEHDQPETANLQYQDWGTPWTDYPLTQQQKETLLEYASHFYFESNQ